MIPFVTIVSLALVIGLLSPFFLGPGGALASASAKATPAELRAMQEAILQRYLADEAALSSGHMSQRSWRQRQEFLLHRYIDAARRLDFLEGGAD